MLPGAGTHTPLGGGSNRKAADGRGGARSRQACRPSGDGPAVRLSIRRPSPKRLPALSCLVLSAGSESFRVCQIWASTTRRRTGRRSASRRRSSGQVSPPSSLVEAVVPPPEQTRVAPPRCQWADGCAEISSVSASSRSTFRARARICLYRSPRATCSSLWT